jgi:hypothetical protein
MPVKIISAVTNHATMTFIHRTIRVGMVKANQTCFDLVQLAEEITEEMQLWQNRTANTIYTLRY